MRPSPSSSGVVSGSSTGFLPRSPATKASTTRTLSGSGSGRRARSRSGPGSFSLSTTQEKLPPVTGFLYEPGVSLTTCPVTTLPLFRKRTDGGLSANTGVNDDGGDPGWRKKRAADVNYAALPLTSTEVTALSAAITTAGTNIVYPLGCIAKSTAAARANQGFCLRFSVDGTAHHAYDYIGGMLFGQYGVVLRGDGMAELWEYAPPKGGGARRWSWLTGFRWAKSGRITKLAHCLIVYPHLGVHGERFISFYGSEMDTAHQASFGSTATTGGARGDSGSMTSTEFLFKWDESLSQSDPVVSDTTVTESAIIQIFERNDLQSFWQISKLVFHRAGFLFSEPWGFPPGDARSVDYWAIQRSPAGASVTPTPTTNVGGGSISLKFDLASDGSDTPILWGYRLWKNAVVQSPPRAAFTSKGGGFAFNVGGADPRGDGATFTVEDRTEGATLLRNRGEIPCRIVVSETPEGGGSPVDTTLFRGYALKPHRTRIGKSGRRAGAAGTGAIDWAGQAQWSRYQVACAGMWHRLSQVTTRSALAWEFFAYDQSGTVGSNGEIPGWKVTDAISYLLQVGGFTTDMIRIPDLPVRLRPGLNAGLSERIVEPGVSVAEMAVKLALSFLGRYLVFDPTDGAKGKWTLTGPPAAGTPTPLMNFVAGQSGEGAILKSWVRTDNYAAGTVPTLGRPESYVEPPECNHLWLMTFLDADGTGGKRVDNHIYNHWSYPVPGSTVTCDPTSPHFIGEERLMIVADPTLWAGSWDGKGGWKATQDLIDFILMRLFIACCMARRFVSFTSPLSFVTDPVTGLKRLPRYYDPVTYLGEPGWFVSGCLPSYSSDRNQTMRVTLSRLVPYGVS